MFLLVYRIEYTHAALGVAGDADVVRVHLLIEYAVRVAVLLQQPDQGGIGRGPGAGAGVFVTQDDKAPGG